MSDFLFWIAGVMAAFLGVGTVIVFIALIIDTISYI